MTTRIRSVSTVYQERLRKVLKTRAQELLSQFVHGGPPYNPFLVAQGLHVTVQATNLIGIEGYVETKDGKYVAVISTNSQETRRRFTLAHELCHVLLMRKAEGGRPVRLIRFRANGNLPGLHQDPVEESLCNFFAGELLMPSEEIRVRLSSCPIEPEVVFNLARTYDVSTHAAAVQIVRALRDRVIAGSFWNLETLWPVPLWWTGFRTQYQSELRKLEGLVERKSELIEVWQSYGGRSGRVRVMVTPTPAKRYAVVLVVKD